MGIDEPRLERAIKLTKVALVTAFLCVVLMIVALSTTVILHEREQSNSARITAGEMRACERLNTVRHQSNVANLVQWDGDQESAARSQALARHSAGASREIRLRGATRTYRLAARLTYTPLTNCAAAVDDPVHYVAPTSLPFLSMAMNDAARRPVFHG